MHKWLSQQGYYHRHMASTSPKANVQIDTICEAEANGVVECLFGGISERHGVTLSSHRCPLSRHRCRANALTGHTYNTKMSRSSN